MKLHATKLYVPLLLLFAMCAYSQKITVTGTVKNQSNEKLPGVSITNATKQSVQTDFDGSFSIASSKNEVLLVSYIGYDTQIIKVTDDKVYNITLNAKLEDLSEIVVVGYGTQKKSVVTGAISRIKAKDIENLPVTRLEQSLQGRISGISVASTGGQPGAPADIRIRGITTFGNNNPLYVVDGVVIDNGGIGTFNQSDIESIEVLKDGSAAIYGTRGATGVILITTKKGKAGKINVTYNGFTGISAPNRKLNLLNAAQYATLTNEAYAAANRPLPFSDPNALGAGSDWQSTIFNNSAQRFSHELGISGGSENSNFFLSVGLLDQQGIVATDISNYNRKNIRLNSNHNLSKFVRIGQTLGYSNEKNVGLGTNNSEFSGPLASAINLDPTTAITVTDPILAAQAPYNFTGIIKDDNGNPYGISTLVGQELVNPLAYINTRLGNFGEADNFVGNAFLEIEPIKNLKLRSSVGAKLAYFGGRSFTPISYLNSSTIVSQNNISKSINRNFGWNNENTITYNRTFQKHNATILGGYGVYVDNIGNGSNVTYFRIPVTNYQDAAFFPNYPNDLINSNSYQNQVQKTTSLFSRLNYEYDDKYLLTGIVRRDGSTQFGPNNRYGIFHSVSLGWVLSKENFLKDNKFINFLKIRGGTGVLGNDKITSNAFRALIATGGNYSFGNGGDVIVGSSPDRPSNPDLKWEETRQDNIGFEATFFQNFKLAVDFYKKNTTGILQEFEIPGFIGATNRPVGNISSMENRGVDVEAGFKKSFNKLQFSLNGNVSYLENEITDIGRGLLFIDGPRVQSGAYPVARSAVGQQVNAFYGFQTQGIFQNQAEVDAYRNSSNQLIQPLARPGDFKWKDNNGDGAITADDRTFLGNPIPKFSFGFTLNLEYENFDFMTFFQGVAGNKIYQATRRLDVANANYQTNALGRWTGEGTSNTFPRLTVEDTNLNFSTPSDFHLQDGDYLRMKLVQIGYSIPNRIVNKAGIQKTRIYLTGENLFTFTKYMGFDPEIAGGIDRGFYPQPKSFMLGVNLSL